MRAVGLSLALSLGIAPVAMPQARIGVDDAERILAPLVESYGVSGSEGPVRAMVQRLLPGWANSETDSAGNLWVRAGAGAPVVVFIAHLDEIGFRVSRIREDGQLELQPAGGFFPALYDAEPALVHTSQGIVPGVFIPLDSADATAAGLRVDLGTGSRAATTALGVEAGATVTMPKRYVRLAGHRATGRSFDDRVGCAALLLALRSLDPRRLRHQVVFIWSVREETGLEGARVAADALGAGATRVHAIDTFVSADAPLEIPTYALAPLGRGPVVRALDNSAAAPPVLVDSLVALARGADIPLQVGATSGGNDGSTFAPYGVPDVALGWPLRYSHSPAETVDLGDVAGLASLIRLIAERW